ncbi:ABC transporter substrate-binding protein [Nocardia sp. NPDC058176]|uniref:ABC transporter substrate-binding protein n=1 Tax=Nocardia sp. NPDC058176 TaxID=3346368 RepID=UPI0036D8210B
MRSSSVLRRTVAGTAVSAIFVGVLVGCSADPEQPQGSGGTVEVAHARGTAQVPEDPQRVVVLEPLELDTAVALGVTPVGAAVASNVSKMPAYLGVEGVEPVGTVPEPDLEAIAALRPDLILGTESRHSKLFEQLNSIAPTVFMATHSDPWRQNALLIGKALNRQEQTQQLLDGVDTRCAELADEHAVDGRTVQMIRPRDETTLSLYGPTSFAGSLLECVGFTIPDQQWVDGLQADLSPENVRKASADVVFVTATDVNDKTKIPAAVTHNADAFGSVTLVDTSYWVSGVGPKGAHKVLDDIEQFLDANR